MAKAVFKKHRYVNLEAPDVRLFAEQDPRGFLETYPGNVIIDEIQYVPGLMSYIQTLVDDEKKMGRFILTGSSQFALHQQLTQSLAGRVALFTLLPFSLSEIDQHTKTKNLNATMFQGFYPPIFDRKIPPNDFYSDYLQTYIEKDVRNIVNVTNLTTFQRFLQLCAGRTGQLLNQVSLANDVGISNQTVRNWLSILSASFVLYEHRPYFNNFSKRLIKSPKLYFYDVGVLCFLLGIKSADQLMTHPLRGSVFENLIINECLKHRLNNHERPELYFFRDSNGTEIDLIFEHKNTLRGIEIKAGMTFQNDFLKSLKTWQTFDSQQMIKKSFLIYGGDTNQTRSDATVLSWRDLLGVFE